MSDPEQILHCFLVTLKTISRFCKNPTIPFIFPGLSEIAAFLMW